MRRVGDHERNVGPMHAAPRCGARTRGGSPCQAPAIAGKSRCRMHGGKGSGAPKGNQNALTRGLHTAPMRQRRARIRALIRRADDLLSEIGGDSPVD